MNKISGGDQSEKRQTFSPMLLSQFQQHEHNSMFLYLALKYSFQCLHIYLSICLSNYLSIYLSIFYVHWYFQEDQRIFCDTFTRTFRCFRGSSAIFSSVVVKVHFRKLSLTEKLLKMYFYEDRYKYHLKHCICGFYSFNNCYL